MMPGWAGIRMAAVRARRLALDLLRVLGFSVARDVAAEHVARIETTIAQLDELILRTEGQLAAMRQMQRLLREQQALLTSDAKPGGNVVSLADAARRGGA